MERETWGGHRQETYADTFGRNLNIVLEEIVKQIRQFVMSNYECRKSLRFLLYTSETKGYKGELSLAWNENQWWWCSLSRVKLNTLLCNMNSLLSTLGEKCGRSLTAVMPEPAKTTAK